jgi:hypothetical protein
MRLQKNIIKGRWELHEDLRLQDLFLTEIYILEDRWFVDDLDLPT